MTSHVAAETLALLAEGLLDSEQARSAQAHLAECTECAETSAGLAEVTAMLTEASFPELSEATVARLNTALADPELIAAAPLPDPAWGEEGQHRTAEEQSDTAVPPKAPVIPLEERRPRRRITRWMPYLVAAAAAVFVVGGTAALFGSPGNPKEELSPGLAEPHTEEEGPDAALPYGGPVSVHSGVAYTAEDFAEQSAALIERSELPDVSEEEIDAPPLTPLPEDEAEAAEACAQEANEDAPGRLMLIDRAVYETEPAWVLVFAEPDLSSLEGYTVQALPQGCGTTAEETVSESPSAEVYLPVEQPQESE